MGRNYSRQSFEAVRTSERERLRALEAAAANLGIPADAVRTAFDAGLSVEQFRADWDKRLARAAADKSHAAIHRIPDAERLRSHAATAAALRVLFGRDDLAERVEDQNKIARRWRGRVRDCFSALLGARSDAYSVEKLARLAFDAAESESYRQTLASYGAGGQQGGLPASELGAATRDASMVVVDDAWQQGGEVWRAAGRVIDIPDHHVHRVWCGRSGEVDLGVVGEGSGAVETTGNAARHWPSADVQVPSRGRSAEIRLSRQRIYNGGFREFGAFLSASVRSFNDDLDAATAAALASAAEVSAAVGLILTEAPKTLNAQQIGGLPLGSARPVILAGEGRRDLLTAAPGAPRVEGDYQAGVERVIFSTALASSAAFAVHGFFRPVVVPALGGEVQPQLVTGQNTGLLRDGAPDPLSAVVHVPVGDPVALTAGAAVVGAVRLTVSTDGGDDG